jgi:hypothetical protein
VLERRAIERQSQSGDEQLADGDAHREERDCDRRRERELLGHCRRPGAHAESVLILAVLAQSCRSRGRTLVYRSGEMLSSPRCLQVEPVMAAEHALWRCSPPAWHVTRPSPLRALFLEHLEARPRWPSNHLRVSPGGPHTAPIPHSLTGRYHEAGPLSLREGDRGEGKSQRCSYLSWLAVLGAGLPERAGGTWARQ